jgi:hypothetical protein
MSAICSCGRLHGSPLCLLRVTEVRPGDASQQAGGRPLPASTLRSDHSRPALASLWSPPRLQRRGCAARMAVRSLIRWARIGAPFHARRPRARRRRRLVCHGTRPGSYGWRGPPRQKLSVAGEVPAVRDASEAAGQLHRRQSHARPGHPDSREQAANTRTDALMYVKAGRAVQVPVALEVSRQDPLRSSFCLSAIRRGARPAAKLPVGTRLVVELGQVIVQRGSSDLDESARLALRVA